jgi:hypothetical protein
METTKNMQMPVVKGRDGKQCAGQEQQPVAKLWLVGWCLAVQKQAPLLAAAALLWIPALLDLFLLTEPLLHLLGLLQQQLYCRRGLSHLLSDL